MTDVARAKYARKARLERKRLPIERPPGQISSGVNIALGIALQPSYSSMLNRWVEKELLGTLEQLGVGCIAFSPLAQGLLTNKYLNGIPENSRANDGLEFQKRFLSEENLKRVRALNEIANKRGQSLAQMAIAWVLRDMRVSSALIGALNAEQLDDSLDALKQLPFTDEELSEIDLYAREGSIDLWRDAREGVA